MISREIQIRYCATRFQIPGKFRRMIRIPREDEQKYFYQMLKVQRILKFLKY